MDDMGFDPALLAVQEGQSDIAMAGISITEDHIHSSPFNLRREKHSPARHAARSEEPLPVCGL